MAILLGMALVGGSIGGIVTYVFLYSVPTFISGCLLLAFAGLALLFSEVRVDDTLLFGVSMADLVVGFVASYKEGFARYMALMSIPNLSPEDVAIVTRHQPAALPAPPPPCTTAGVQ